MVETDLFADALTASISKSSRDTTAKKRKRRPSESKDGKTVTTPTSPTTSVISAPLKFYQDTLEEGKEVDNKDATKANDDKDENGMIKKRNRIEEIEPILTKEEEPEEPPVKKQPGVGTGPDGPPGILKITRTKCKKKSISWKTQETLVEVRYFELDETERVNVTRTFTDLRAKDLQSEKMSIIMARKLQNEDVMQEKTSWAVLHEVENVPAHPLGKESTERKAQSDRERTVLQALYFNRSSIPDTPAEPDYEPAPVSDPKVIALEDVSGNPDSINDLRLVPWPEPRGDTPKVEPQRSNISVFNDFSRQVPPPSIQPWVSAPQNLPPQLGGPFVDPLHLAALNMNPLQMGGLPPQFVPPFGPPGGPMMMTNPMGGPPPMMGGPPMGGPPMGGLPMGGPPMGGPGGPSLNFNPPPPTRSGPPPPQAHDWVRGRYNRDRDRRRGGWDRDRDDRRDDDRRDRDRGICRNYQKYGNCKSAKCNFFHPR